MSPERGYKKARPPLIVLLWAAHYEHYNRRHLDHPLWTVVNDNDDDQNFNKTLCCVVSSAGNKHRRVISAEIPQMTIILMVADGLK